MKFQKSNALLCAMLILGPVVASERSLAVQPQKTIHGHARAEKLVWSDEFNGKHLDPGKWVAVNNDSGYGNNLNMAHMVHEYEGAGITAVCVEDKLYPKMNSFAGGDQLLLPTVDFGRKLEVAKAAQQTADFFLIARTEALICGAGVDEALPRRRALLPRPPA